MNTETSRTLVKDTVVVNLLAEAVIAGVSLYRATMDAARNAAGQLDMSKPADEAIAEVRSLYVDDFGGNANIRSIFTDGITLAYAGSAPVSFPTGKDKNGKETEMHTTGIEAMDLPKHNMRAATKAVRDDLGIGRASGGGRKPRQPAATVADTKAEAEAKAAPITDGPDFEAQLAAKIERDLAGLRVSLKRLGYRLQKISK
jgi:hypothetical protein